MECLVEKRFLSESDGILRRTWWAIIDDVGHTQEAKKEIFKMYFGNTKEIFDNAKAS